MDKIKPQIGPIEKREALLKNGSEWLHFAHPFQWITAENLNEVLPALKQVEKLVKEKGWYAAGFLSYEAAAAFDPALETRTPRSGILSVPALPYLWFGLYPEPKSIKLPSPRVPKAALDWRPTIERTDYHRAIARIKDHIEAGRTYQVNYTMRLQSDFSGSAWQLFLHLVRHQNRHAAYIDTGRYVICSASPELFFELDGNTITSQPMKGTTSRGRTTAEDLAQADWLKHSIKNRAENVMIVDMIRNDLGRIAEVGSISVPKLFETERYPTLWQMTSTVTARTKSSLTEIFAALFPCASITGAPKASTMKIIAELETSARQMYTGTIGYLTPHRHAKFNVAIRTVLIDREDQKAEYGVGGGIVWDSAITDEYAEALLKAKVLTEDRPEFALLETLLWTPDQGYVLREKHVARMLDSADYFDIPLQKEALDQYLDEISSAFSAPRRVRVLLNQDGSLDYESHLFSFQATPLLKARLAREPVNSGNVFLFHKTTRREAYESAREGLEEFNDVLLYNQRGELTEFTIGNLVVELDGQFFTPPLRCGVLAGTFRAHLLETGRIRERLLSIPELDQCTKLFRINSIRGWQEVELHNQHRTAVEQSHVSST